MRSASQRRLSREPSVWAGWTFTAQAWRAGTATARPAHTRTGLQQPIVETTWFLCLPPQTVTGPGACSLKRSGARLSCVPGRLARSRGKDLPGLLQLSMKPQIVVMGSRPLRKVCGACCPGIGRSQRRARLRSYRRRGRGAEHGDAWAGFQPLLAPARSASTPLTRPCCSGLHQDRDWAVGLHVDTHVRAEAPSSHL